jgi:hypothetical protein
MAAPSGFSRCCIPICPKRRSTPRSTSGSTCRRRGASGTSGLAGWRAFPARLGRIAFGSRFTRPSFAGSAATSPMRTWSSPIPARGHTMRIRPAMRPSSATVTPRPAFSTATRTISARRAFRCWCGRRWKHCSASFVARIRGRPAGSLATSPTRTPSATGFAPLTMLTRRWSTPRSMSSASVRRRPWRRRTGSLSSRASSRTSGSTARFEPAPRQACH